MNRFEIQSIAKITLPEGLMLNSPDTIKVVTYLQTREPPRPPPGQGNKKTIKILKLIVYCYCLFCLKECNVDLGHAINMLTVTMILAVKSFLVDVYLDFKEMDIEAATEHQACKLTKAILAYVNNCYFFSRRPRL